MPEETEVITEDVKLKEAENEQSKHAYSVALATAVAAEAAVAAAQAAAEVVRLTSQPRHLGKSKEEIAAIRIQTTFRGYLVYIYIIPFFNLLILMFYVLIYYLMNSNIFEGSENTLC